MSKHLKFLGMALAISFLLVESLQAQLRIVDYNTAGVGNSSAMTTVLQAIRDESVNGVSKTIDAILLQELGSGDITTILNILNGQGNGTYAVGNVGSTTGAGGVGLVYRTETLDLVAQSQVVNTSSTGAARGVMRYTLRPDGYDSSADFYIYNSHYKSSDTSADAARRNVEAAAIRANSDALGQGAHAIYVGDFNIYRSSEPMWATLTAAGNGQAFDPVNQVGNWHDGAAFIGVHTQNPAGSGGVGGGMDDRFDWQMITGELQDNAGMSIIAGSYHAFANNGTHAMNGHINTGTGASATVLNALGAATDHLPVVAQYQVPAKMNVAVGAVPAQVIQGASLSASVNVNNSAGDGVIVVNAVGADELDYTVTASGSASGSQNGSDQAFGGSNSHLFSLDTATAGAKAASFATNATSPQVPNPTRSNSVNYSVLDHATSSFDSSLVSTTLSYDFGTLAVGATNPTFSFDLSNLNSLLGFTAGLELDSILGTGNTSTLTTDLSVFSGLLAGESNSYQATFDTSVAGTFSASYVLNFSDIDLPGAIDLGSLTLNLSGVVGVPEPAALSLIAFAIVALATPVRSRKSR